MLMNKLSRRGFVQVLTATAAVSALPSWVAASTKVPAKWDEAVDVVIIGSGFAGLAAAYEAKKAGATVALLEKMRVAGGNSAINGGILAVPGSPLQKKLGIKDSPELMAKDMIKAGDAMNHLDKVKALCEAAVGTYRWTVDELGVKYQDKNIKQEGGHTVPAASLPSTVPAPKSSTRNLPLLKSSVSSPVCARSWKRSSSTTKAAWWASRSVKATASPIRIPAR